MPWTRFVRIWHSFCRQRVPRIWAISKLKYDRSACSYRSRRNAMVTAGQQQQATQGQQQQPKTEKPSAKAAMQVPPAAAMKGTSPAHSTGKTLSTVPGSTAQTATRVPYLSASSKSGSQGTSPLSNLAKSPYASSIGTAPSQTVHRSGLASGNPNLGVHDAGSFATSKAVQGRQVMAQQNVQTHGGMTTTGMGGRGDLKPFQNGGGHLGLGSARLPPIDCNARGMAMMGGGSRMTGPGNYL